MRVERRGVTEGSRNLERPQRRLDVLVQWAGGHVTEAEDAAADARQQAAILHLLQAMWIDAESFGVARGDVAELSGGLFTKQVVEVPGHRRIRVLRHLTQN